MRSILRTALLALILAAAPVLVGGISHAAAGTGSGAAAVGVAAAAEQPGTAGSLAPLAGYTLTASTPSPGDTASTAPANPGTGETAQNEAKRLDFAPWVIGGIALATLIVVLVWHRRRGKTTIV